MIIITSAEESALWAQDGRLFHPKIVISCSSSVIMNFSLIELISFIDPLHQKNSKKPDVGNC